MITNLYEQHNNTPDYKSKLKEIINLCTKAVSLIDDKSKDDAKLNFSSMEAMKTEMYDADRIKKETKKNL